MSQKKVDQYKEYKANKKKILKREKIKKKLIDWCVYIAILVIGTAVLTAAVGQIMYKYKRYQASKPDYTVSEKKIEDLAKVLTPNTKETESESGSETEQESGSEKETESDKETESAKETETESEKEKESESERESGTEKASEEGSESVTEQETESEKAAE